VSIASSAVSAWALGVVWHSSSHQEAKAKIDNDMVKITTTDLSGVPTAIALGHREIGTQQALSFSLPPFPTHHNIFPLVD